MQKDRERVGGEVLKLYGIWQTEAWKPEAVAAGEAIPANDFGNIEAKLINPGLVHLRRPGPLAKLCKKMGLPYVPCLVDFDPVTGYPNISGIVVHSSSSDLVLDAFDEWKANEADKYEAGICDKWRGLVGKLMIGERLKRDWGDLEKGEKEEEKEREGRKKREEREEGKGKRKK